MPAGRLFLRCLIDLSTKAKKLHHHVKLNSEAMADFQWWHSFLPDWPCSLTPLGPMLELYTDVSETLGYGAYFQGHWFRAVWKPHQHPPFESIQWQELSLCCRHCTQGLGSLLEGQVHSLPLWPSSNAWSHKSSWDPVVSSLLRTLFLVAAQDNFNISLHHLPGKSNALADALSWNQMDRFFTLAPHADPQPTVLTSHC